MRNKSDVIIVGAGASGLMAAISAARMGAQVLILEHMDQAGKKILSTGNGKCNFTNRVQGVEFYRGENPAFVLPILKQFGLKQTLAFFEEAGLWPIEKRAGYFYPISGQASAVRTVLLLEAKRLSVQIHYNIGIRNIKKEQQIFVFDTKQGQYESRVCVIATGGKAAKKTGSDGSGIPYIVGFGHKMSDFVPALVQLQGKQSFLKELAGIRAEARLQLYADDTKLSEDIGEIQLTNFGVSGIPAFQVSRFGILAMKKGKKVHVLLDFFPKVPVQELYEKMKQHVSRHQNTERIADILPGILHTKLIPVVLKEAGISPVGNISDCTQKAIEKLVYMLKHFRIDIIGNKPFENAQVSAGGVSTDEIGADTMESMRVRNLFFAGEVVDIDGMCGGYNLQWAWSSGWVAGHHGGMR